MRPEPVPSSHIPFVVCVARRAIEGGVVPVTRAVGGIPQRLCPAADKLVRFWRAGWQGLHAAPFELGQILGEACLPLRGGDRVPVTVVGAAGKLGRAPIRMSLDTLSG